MQQQTKISVEYIDFIVIIYILNVQSWTHWVGEKIIYASK